MTTPDQLDKAICRRDHERFAAAIIAAKAAGIFDLHRRKIGSLEQNSFFRSVTVDAAEALGIPCDMLDLSRESHINTLSKVAAALIMDEVDAAPGSTENPLSSYAKKKHHDLRRI